MNGKIKNSKILFMSSFPPTECGIATFTTDIIKAISRKFSESFTCIKCDLKKEGQPGSFAEYVLNSTVREEYSKIAQELNLDNAIKLIHIQHEFGLFGGSYGDYLFDFLNVINKPVVFTFHTVLSNPNDELKAVVKSLASHAMTITVMTHRSAEILQEEYDIDPKLIEYIPHGTHLVKWAEGEKLKEKYGFSGKILLSTFGLLSSGKSIETALYALPEMIEKFPEVFYLIIGKTHPNNIQNDRDTYREYLEALVKALGISKYVIFIDRYVELQELLELLQATDIYLFTSKDPNQAVSGTFAYAMSCACPIIATSIPHTREILTKDLGYIINIGDSKQLAKAGIKLLSNKKLRERMSLNTFQNTSASSWENIATRHVKLYHKLLKIKDQIIYDYPPINLSHFNKLTTERGMIQFSKICIPDISSGYTLDDNARALIALCMHFESFKETRILKNIKTYVNFIERCQTPQGTFVNYIDEYDKVHIKNDYVNLEDSNARAVWALGTVIFLQNILPEEITNKALLCMLKCDPWIAGVLSPRAIGFTIKGLYKYLQVKKESYISRHIENLAANLITRYDINQEKEWQWFEENLTYANSILPESLLYAYLVTGNEAYKKTSLESFDFLLSKMFVNGDFRVISNRGWYQKGTQPNRYGEQPIDVFCIINSLDIFYKTFKNEAYKDLMKRAFNWFLGENHLSQIVYNPLTGGCRDGVEEKNVNINQGAESTVCYLMARILMEGLDKPVRIPDLSKKINEKRKNSRINRSLKGKVRDKKTGLPGSGFSV
ncbi:glycosyltransferase [Gillisia limnaea]|uniref:Glycosyl transferase group 1 n=2 Tax=Gillisia TaxID=244698 RepID=H2BY31_GILLR|nr:glycosyltransferase [Gillisia limnaea]EHQ03237.1 glycosyl transferase group 1 [Gillisia limnaea DSM 15749]